MFRTDQPARTRVRRNAATLLALASALLLAGCYADATPTPPKQRAVHVEPVRVESLGEHHAYTGVVRARFETPMAFRVAGKLATRDVDVGAAVKKGQVLATLDATDYNHGLAAATSEVKAAEAEVVRARGDEERSKYLFERGHVAQAQVERFAATFRTASERLAAAESQRSIAANRVAYTTLVADADGVVTEVSAERGQVVAEGRPVFSIARMGEKEAVVAIPENRVGDLAQMQARVSFWSQPGKSYAAELRELSPQADPATRTYVARFRLLEMPERVDLGMTATIELSKPAAEARIRIPVSAIWYRGDAAQVWRAHANGKLEAVPVAVRELGQETALVSGALADGDTIVTLGVHRLDESMQVRFANRVKREAAR
jgi:multidrug efflux system membrane fusion protein